ncbi:MAG: T9SS type A sorting domain-containing protein [Bacteroidia bacterium]|nr:T9SS type A sorting domain-containing protein [Bacteroidia bacterium]
MKNLITILLLCLSGLSAFAQSSIPIRETARFPDSVLHTGSAVLPDGKVIVWGGQKQVFAPNGKIWLSKKSYIYDPVPETWAAGPDLHAEVVNPTVVTLPNGNIVSMDGQGYKAIFTIDSIMQRTHGVEMYDVTTQTWVELDTVPFGNSPYTGTSAVVTPDSNIWLTSTNGDYATFDTKTMLWTDQTGLFGPLDAGGRPIVVLDNGILFHTGAGGQYYDISTQIITYADPIIPMYPANVVKLEDGRILTWDDGFSFSQEAIMVNATGTGSSITDSLIIPGQATTGALMPDGKVWVLGLGEVQAPYTLLQIFDPTTDTWSSPGTYNFRPEILTGYHLHLLQDSSLVVITTTKTASYRINAGESSTRMEDRLPLSDWNLLYEAQQHTLRIQAVGQTGKTAVNFSLMDLQGKILIHQQGIVANTEILLNFIPAGIYIARLLGENGSWQVKKIRVN